MRRLATVVLAFVLLAGVVGFTRGNPAAAQDATVAPHPIVGEWRFENDLGNGITFPSIAIFHADGTYIEDFPDASSFSMGLWQPTGERTAIVTVYQVYVIDDKLANGEGRFTAEVDETGNAMTTNGTFVGTFEDGTIDIAVEGPSTASRLGILPVVPLSQLVSGGTPVIPPDLTAATPAP